MSDESQFELSKIEQDIVSTNEEIAQLVKQLTELPFKYISDDISNWLSSGGCLDCDGKGFTRPWGATASSEDAIRCPVCNGESPKHSLSFSFRTHPNVNYFPEQDFKSIDDARALGLSVSAPPFWTKGRSSECSTVKASLEKARLKLQNLAHSKNTIMSAQKKAAVAAVEKVASDNSGGLPDLIGVSTRQINYGCVCRAAALESGKISLDEAKKIASAVYWIENFKNLVRR